MKHFTGLLTGAGFLLLAAMAMGQSATNKKPLAGPSGDQYVTPQGAGDKSGRDWAHARPAAELQAALDAAGAGNSVRVGSGTYQNVSLKISAGGSGPDAVKSFVGVDTGGGLPVFKSDFDRNNPAHSGRTLVTVSESVSHVVIKDLVVQGHNMAVRLRGKQRGVRVENVDVTNTRDAFWIEGGATRDAPGTQDLIVRDCDVKNFTKRGFRILGGVSRSYFINCHVDAGGKAFYAEAFPIGFHMLGGKNGVTDNALIFVDCSASNAWHENPVYWNADGFAAESATKDLVWIRCSASGNTDGGWDLKTLRPRLIDCTGIDNKRNFRFWAREAPAVMENCLSAFSLDHGKLGHELGVWLKGGGGLSMTRCTLWGNNTGLAVEEGTEEKRTAVKLDRCLLVPAQGGVALRLCPGVDLQNTASILRQDKGDPPVALRQASKTWRGGDDAFDATSHPDLGYHHQKPAPLDLVQLARLLPAVPEPPRSVAPETPRMVLSSSIAKPGSDQHVTPQGAGDKSGRDWAHARSAADLQAALDAAGPGNSVRVGSGTYQNVSLQFNTGGSGPDAVKALVGVDTGGGLPVFKGNFDNHNAAKTGGTLVTVAANVSHARVSDVVVQNHRTAVKLSGRHLGLRIENVDVTNTRDAFWVDGGASPEAPHAGTRDLVLRDCDVKNFTKRGIRFLNGNANVQVINCHVDAGGKAYSTEVFPIGVHILGGENGVTDKNITFTDCSAANAWHDAGTKYWNGDGWAAEGGSSDITWIRCAAYNNTDGGWDIKALRPKLVDCISIGNKRNYRLWARPEAALMENCLSAFSAASKSGAPGTGFWIKGGAKLQMTRCTLWGDGASVTVEDGTKEKPTTLTLERCLLVPAETGAALRLSAGVDLQNMASILRKDKKDKNDPLVALRQPSPTWRGGDDSFDSTSHPDLGYRHQKPASTR